MRVREVEGEQMSRVKVRPERVKGNALLCSLTPMEGAQLLTLSKITFLGRREEIWKYRW